MSAPHVILGAGTVGLATARHLVAAGHATAVVSRTAPHDLPPGVEHRRGDVLDLSFLTDATTGAAVVYQVLNAPYHRWPELFPPLQRAAVDAATTAGARLVSFENIYMYGRAGTEPFAEDSPHRPCSTKGQVRAEMAAELASLRQQGTLDALQVRANDLFGPGMVTSALGDQVFARVAAGKRPRVLGNPEAQRTWAFVDDAGATMAAMGTAAPGGPPVVHVPSEPPRSFAQILSRTGEILGRDIPFSVTPPWMLRLLGWVVPEAGAVVETLYGFEEDFVLHDRVARQQLGLSSTPFDIALTATLAAFGAHRALEGRARA